MKSKLSQDDTPKKIKIDATAHFLYLALMSEIRVQEVTIRIAAEEYKQAAKIDVNFNPKEPLNPYRVPLHRNLAKESGRLDYYA